MLKKAEERVSYCNACETADEVYKIRRSEADVFYDIVSAIRKAAQDHEEESY